MRHTGKPNLTQQPACHRARDRRVCESLRENWRVVAKPRAYQDQDERHRDRKALEGQTVLRSAVRGLEDSSGDRARVDGDVERRQATREDIVGKLSHLTPSLTTERSRSRARPMARRADSALKPTICPTEAV